MNARQRTNRSSGPLEFPIQGTQANVSLRSIVINAPRKGFWKLQREKVLHHRRGDGSREFKLGRFFREKLSIFAISFFGS